MIFRLVIVLRNYQSQCFIWYGSARDIFGYISDYFGRRKILILSTSISSVGTLMCLAAPNVYALIIGRLIQGLGF